MPNKIYNPDNEEDRDDRLKNTIGVSRRVADIVTVF